MKDINDIKMRIRICQEDIRKVDSGAVSSISTNWRKWAYDMSDPTIEDIIEYRAFCPSRAALMSYEQISKRLPADLIIDIGSGVGTGILSVCAETQSKTQIVGIEPNEKKRNIMREYLKYCGLLDRVAVVSTGNITPENIRRWTQKNCSTCLIFIDCWPVSIPAYVFQILQLPDRKSVV